MMRGEEERRGDERRIDDKRRGGEERRIDDKRRGEEERRGETISDHNLIIAIDMISNTNKMKYFPQSSFIFIVFQTRLLNYLRSCLKSNLIQIIKLCEN